MYRRLSLTSLALFALSAFAGAESLILTPRPALDISALPLNSVGDLAFSEASSRLWLCDGGTNGQVYEVNRVTGAVISQFSPASIPGLNLGPDALAFPRNGLALAGLYVFSSFSESEGGHVSNTGALLSDFGTSHGATGADFDEQGNLWIASGTAVGGGSTLMRLDETTGAILFSVPIAGTSLRVVDLAFDPHTGACYCLLESWILIEVNTSTGAQVSSTDLTPFVPGATGVAGGIAFHNFGQELFVAASNGSTAGEIVVLRRDYGSLACDSVVSGGICPCGNIGLPGRGCNNSFATGGAQITTSGIPSVTFDSCQLQVTGLPPTAPALLFQSTTTTESVPLVIDDGLICLGGSIVRLSTRAAVAGQLAYPTGSDVALHVRGQIPSSGGTRYYQCWYRNAANFCTPGTSNFSNAIQMRWEP